MGIKKHCKLLIPLFISSLLLLVVGCGEPKGDPNVSALGGNPFTTEGIPVRWGDTQIISPLDLGITQAFLEEFTPAQNDGLGHNLFEQMMKEWDGGMGSIDFLKVPATTLTNNSYTSLNQYRDSELGIYKSLNWFNNVSNGALAITQFFGVRINAGTADEYLQLTHADIIVNYRDYTYSYDPNNFSKYDLVSVVLHELGHFLGLPHETASGVPSVMQPYISTFESNRFIYSADANALTDLYSQVGSSSVSGFQAQTSLSNFQNNNSEFTAPTKGEEVQGIFELRADGECRHYINGKFINGHKSQHKLK
ncbi:MAG: matrixin family metalloprotease [Bacteriovoracaceae bacterium]|jgi:hypothetical protein|nr:matrixin family metalloprotease [Bacteriovoracaceae bacterium]